MAFLTSIFGTPASAGRNGRTTLAAAWCCRAQLLRLAWLALALAWAACCSTAWALAPKALPAVPAAAMAAPHFTAEERAWLQAHPVIRLGVDRSYAPYSSQNRQGRFEGASADFVALLGKQLGIQFQVMPARSWAEQLQAVRKREIDVITPAALTPDRETYLVFTDEYLNTPLVIMTRNDDYTLRAATDLAYRTVAVVKGYSSTSQVLKAHPNVRALTVNNPLEGLIAVATGEADAYVGAIGVNLDVASRHGIANLRVAAAYDIHHAQRLGVRSDWPILAGILDKALASLPAAEVARIHQQWVPPQIPANGMGVAVLTNAEKAWVAATQRIRVGIASADEPVEMVNAQGVPVGIVPQYLDMIQRTAGLAVEMVPLPSRADLLSALRAGTVDMVSLPGSRGIRNADYKLSNPFYSMALAAYAVKDASFIGSLADLAGKRMAVPEGDRVSTRFAELNGIVPVKVKNALAALQAVQSGLADVCVMDVAAGNFLVRKYGLNTLAPELVLAGDAITLRFATRPDWPELAAITDSAIAAASLEDIANIRRNSLWFEPPRGIPRAQIVLWGAVALSGVLLVFLVQVHWSRRRLAAEGVRRQTAVASAQSSEERFSVTFEQAAVGMALVATSGQWLRVNQRLCDMLGYTEAELKTKTFQDLTHPEDVEIDRMNVAGLLAGEATNYTLEKRYIRQGGATVWATLTVALVHDTVGAPAYFISVVEDITQKKADEEQLAFLAYHDALTGLPNRALVRDRLEQTMADAKRSGHSVALLFIDLDNFKIVNDTLGHLVGDALLVQVAERLRHGLRTGDTVGRQGGDEFLLLLANLPGKHPSAALTAITDKIFEQLKTSFAIDHHELVVQVSMGIATFPEDGHDFETLLRKADTAMYSAKAAGRNTIHFFTEQMNLDAVLYDQLRTGLRQALANQDLQVHYQPQIDLNTQQVVGAEALLRWTHPTLGPISPAQFIPVAEDSGLIVAMGAWVLAQACQDAMAWQQAGLGELSVAVNLSAVQFKRGDLEQTIETVLAQTGLPPHLLELELTESILISDAEMIMATLQRLRTRGMRISIDDFGTGYSSLSYLKRFPVSQLKIDQSFVRDMLSNPEDDAIVNAIIGLASGMSLQTIAEGIETEQQQAALQRMGCQLGQGYLIGRPMPAAAFLAYLQAKATAPPVA